MIRSIFSAATIALLAAAFFGVGICLPGPGRAHEAHSSFSAGEPGDPKKPARVVNVKMFEGSGKMGFEPARIEVRKGEQVRFVLQNNGEEDHEFVLATVRDNRKHAEVVKTHSDMEHDDPEREARVAARERRARLEVQQARGVRIRLSHPRPL